MTFVAFSFLKMFAWFRGYNWERNESTKDVRCMWFGCSVAFLHCKGLSARWVISSKRLTSNAF